MVRPTGAVLMVVVLVSALLAGCGGILRGSGNLKTEQRPFSDFTGVDISSAFEFEITQADSYKVSITADDNVLDKVTVAKEGSTLKIGLKNVVSLGSVTLRAAVTMPRLSSLAVSGASRGTVSDFSSTEKLTLRVSGASKVTGVITVGDADFDVSGASNAQLEGSANNLTARASGASRLNLGGFTVKVANIGLSGASSGTVKPSGRLDADLSGASRLWYLGEPTMGTITTSGASTIGKR